MNECRLSEAKREELAGYWSNRVLRKAEGLNDGSPNGEEVEIDLEGRIFKVMRLYEISKTKYITYLIWWAKERAELKLALKFLSWVTG